MRNIFFILFSLFFFSTSFGQSFEWGISLHPNFSNRRLIALGINTSEQDIITLDSFEMNRPSYSGGIFVNWQSDKLGLFIGLNYMSTGYGTLKYSVIPTDPLFGQADDVKLFHTNTNIELPFIVQFIQRPSEKNSIYFNMGGAFSFNLQNSVNSVYYNGQEKFTTEKTKQDGSLYRKFNYAFQTGMGWKHTFDNGFAVSIEPVFVMWLKGILKDNELNRSIYSLGLKTSFTIGGYELEESDTFY